MKRELIFNNIFESTPVALEHPNSEITKRAFVVVYNDETIGTSIYDFESRQWISTDGLHVNPNLISHFLDIRMLHVIPRE